MEIEEKEEKLYAEGEEKEEVPLPLLSSPSSVSS